MRVSGIYKKIGNTTYFIPFGLPIENPPLFLSRETIELYGQAMLELGKFSQVTHKVPNNERFVKAYIIKEALLSSSIEGIHTTLLDIFTQPLRDAKPNKETQLVMNYTQALEHAVLMVEHENIPISSRVIKHAHYILMSQGDGDKSNPGNYRKQAVRVGELIPPPPDALADLLHNLEAYINVDTSLPDLIKAGIAHAQFEIIHPFLDGNGRIGRLLIVLMLIQSKLLTLPILYPSYYFKKHRLEYYQKLDRIRTHGDFEDWIQFYLKAIRDSSKDAYIRAKAIDELYEKLMTKVTKTRQLSIRMCQMRMMALHILFKFPIINATELRSQLTVSYNTAASIIAYFEELGILKEQTEQKRSKLYIFKPYVELLEKEY